MAGRTLVRSAIAFLTPPRLSRRHMSEPRLTFGLQGPSRLFDRRTNAIRGDLADIALAGKMFAPHYAVPVERMCSVPHALLYYKPDGEAGSELLLNERFWLLDVSGSWAWGYCGHDHYVGYVPLAALSDVTSVAPTTPQGDPVEVARSFLEMPYVWGGRGGSGIDCSGLIQRALAARGIVAPRDSDMQMKSLGKIIASDEQLERGDLVFLPGHVGVMADGINLIHANLHHGKTVVEPLKTVAKRYADANDGVGITARKRISA